MAARCFFVAAAVVALLVPGVESKDLSCGPSSAQTKKVTCDVSVEVGDTFQLDCTGSNEATQPADLLKTDASAVKVCFGTAKRTAVDTACAADSQATIASYASKGITFSTPAPSATGWKIKSDFKGDADVYFHGSCKLNNDDQSVLFNALIKKPASGGSSAATMYSATMGLAAAASIALLGLAAF